jgi:hypothetical protein
MKFITSLLWMAILSGNTAQAQTCPPAPTTGIAISNNTYYAGLQPIVNAGSTSIAIGGPQHGPGGVIYTKDILDISPVPARRYTMIKWPSAGNSKLTVALFDAAGRFVLCRQYEVRQGMNELLLTNLEALPGGVYFIKASDGAIDRNAKLRIQK